MIDLSLHVIGSVVVAYPFMSLIEYMIHRYLMHGSKIARILNSEYLFDAYAEHAVEHHNRCYAVFDRETRACAVLNLTIKPSTSLAVALLPCLLVMPIDAVTAAVLVAGALANATIWGRIHSEMHQPKGAWFSRMWAYRYLRWRHFLHHRHPGTNFNTVFLMWDWLLGTSAIETEADRLEVILGTWRVRPDRERRL
jgi:hypothetical protein